MHRTGRNAGSWQPSSVCLGEFLGGHSAIATVTFRETIAPLDIEGFVIDMLHLNVQ